MLCCSPLSLCWSGVWPRPKLHRPTPFTSKRSQSRTTPSQPSFAFQTTANLSNGEFCDLSISLQGIGWIQICSRPANSFLVTTPTASLRAHLPQPLLDERPDPDVPHSERRRTPVAEFQDTFWKTFLSLSRSRPGPQLFLCECCALVSVEETEGVYTRRLAPRP